MKKNVNIRLAVLVAAILLAVVTATPGCTKQVSALKQTVETAKVLKVDADAEVAKIKASAAALPEGDPTREKLLAGIKFYEDKSAALGVYIAKTEQTISDLEKGVIPAELVASATAIPGVGPYVPIIAIVLPSILALFKSGQASKYKGQFSKLVEAWGVGPDLSPEHQAEAEKIVGPNVAPLLKSATV
jgi:hypothetical protein